MKIFLTLTLCLTLISPVMAAETVTTVYDPAQHTEKMRLHCAELDNQLALMAKREKRGLHKRERERFYQKRDELQGKREKQCAQFKVQ
ncbi:hypothetical protein [Chitinivorax sp. B]|uniref:hypothetical protein n=1 Tax=Chitinivorax sp. B TaxID=2502235 RepID=UPI0010F9512C|nr:hypothetical protein [Chitinivorax sp. B]